MERAQSKSPFRQYSLRTLLIAGLIGPPLLALIWYGLIFASYWLPVMMHDLANFFMLPGVCGTIALATYSAFAPPSGEKTPASVTSLKLGLLGCSEFAALWHWILVLCQVAGWVIIWGDNGPTVSDYCLSLFSAFLAACGTSIVMLRVVLGLASLNYARINGYGTAFLLAMAMLTRLAYWLR